MDTGTSATRFSSYARACRRLAGEVANYGTNGGDPALQTAARLLREASDHFVALAGSRAGRLPEWLVQNALADLLDPAPDAREAASMREPTLRAAGDFAATADLVSFLAVGRRTGRLEVQTAGERFLLVFDAGDIVHAESDNAPVGQRLGDILVQSGAVTPDAVEDALRDAGPVRIGRVLWKKKEVTQAALLAGLEQQIRLLFVRMFDLAPTGFTFWSDALATTGHDVRMNTTGLILDGARAADERSRTP